MTVSYISNFVENALDRQVETLKNLANWIKKVTINAEESQEVEDEIKNFRDNLNVQNGTGTILDVFGKLFNLDRGSLGDEAYRTAILTAYAEFNKAGQIEVLISVYKSLLSANKVTLTEYSPATAILNAEVDDIDDLIPIGVTQAMNKIKVAGVELGLSVSLSVGAFSFISVGDTPDPSLGFSSLAFPTSGGILGQLLPSIVTFTFLNTSSDESLTTESGDKLIFFEGI